MFLGLFRSSIFVKRAASCAAIRIRAANYILGMRQGTLVLVYTASLIFSFASHLRHETLPVFLLHEGSPLHSGHSHCHVLIMSDKAASQPPPVIQFPAGSKPLFVPIFSLDELAAVEKQYLKRQTELVAIPDAKTEKIQDILQAHWSGLGVVASMLCTHCTVQRQNMTVRGGDFKGLQLIMEL